MLQPIEIFKPGRHVAASGAALSFSAAELADAARVYDPALHRAPLVIGHPKTDDLAYGHVAQLSYSEPTKRLIATPADVEADFADMVDDGRLLAVSASFYTPTSPNNPAPGHYYLRHVGFLGAEAPAVKGLKRPAVEHRVQFAEAEDGVVEFADWADSENAGLWRGLRDWVIGKFGLDEADKAVPGYRVESLATAAAQPDSDACTNPTTAISYSEGGDVPQPPNQAALAAQADQLAADRAALDARSAELDARSAAIAQQEAERAQESRMVQFREFAGSLVKQGRLLPVQQARLVEVMGALPDNTVLEFSEGDSTVSKPAVQVLQEFLQSLPVTVDFSERAKDDNKALPDDSVDFNDAASIARAAQTYIATEAAAGRTVSVVQAVSHISSQAPQA